MVRYIALDHLTWNDPIMLTLILNRTLKLKSNGKDIIKAKKSHQGEFEPKTNGILDMKHNHYTMSSILIA